MGLFAVGRGWEAAWLGDGLVGPGKGPSGRGEVTAGKEGRGVYGARFQTDRGQGVHERRPLSPPGSPQRRASTEMPRAAGPRG